VEVVANLIRTMSGSVAWLTQGPGLRNRLALIWHGPQNFIGNGCHFISKMPIIFKMPVRWVDIHISKSYMLSNMICSMKAKLSGQ